jgi:hypothetical protein
MSLRYHAERVLSSGDCYGHGRAWCMFEEKDVMIKTSVCHQTL